MKHLVVTVLVVVASVSLVLSGCGQAAPAPAATKAPESQPAAAPTASQPAKPAEATKPAAAQPTTAPAAKSNYPEKGRAITFIVPFAAGGVNDLGARILAAGMEKELGTPVQVVNKVGAGGQVGLTEMAQSKPDGYTISTISIPSTMSVYLDPERKAVFGRKDLAIVAGTFQDPQILSVQADSPYKTMKDLIEAAKAKPEGIKVAAGTLNSSIDLTVSMVEKTAGVKFTRLHTDGGAQNIPALLGGHVDASFNNSTELRQSFQAGSVRVLGIASKEPSSFFPGAPTMTSLGYPVVFSVDQGVGLPGGTPKEVVETLGTALKKILETDQTKTAMTNVGVSPLYRTPEIFGTTWDQMEPQVKELMALAKKS